MQDADEEEREQRKRAFYPFHQPENAGRERHDPFDAQTEPEIGEPEEKARPHRRRGGPVHQREQIDTPQLPEKRTRNSVIIGAIFGILSIIQIIVITNMNGDLFTSLRQATNAHNQNDINAYSFAIFGKVLVVTFLITLLLCFLAGLITGRIAVHRRLGFVAGFVVQVVTGLGNIVLNLVPFYVAYTPGKSGDTGSITAGLILILITLLIQGAIGGAVGLLGAWLATRRHPFYVGYAG
jgi:hypothetical protein